MSTPCPSEQMQGACPSGREAFSPPPSVCPPPFLHRPLRPAFLPLPPGAERRWRSRLSDSPPTAAPQSQWALVRPTWNCHFLDSPWNRETRAGEEPGGGGTEVELPWECVEAAQEARRSSRSSRQQNQVWEAQVPELSPKGPLFIS